MSIICRYYILGFLFGFFYESNSLYFFSRKPTLDEIYSVDYSLEEDLPMYLRLRSKKEEFRLLKNLTREQVLAGWLLDDIKLFNYRLRLEYALMHEDRDRYYRYTTVVVQLYHRCRRIEVYKVLQQLERDKGSPLTRSETRTFMKLMNKFMYSMSYLNAARSLHPSRGLIRREIESMIFDQAAFSNRVSRIINDPQPWSVK